MSLRQWQEVQEMLWEMSAERKLQRDVTSGETRGWELKGFDDFGFARLARLASLAFSHLFLPLEERLYRLSPLAS